MELDWDPAKRARPRAERGLDVADLARYDWDAALERADIRRDYGEERIVSVGYLDARLIVVAYVIRDRRRRIISMRKANEREQRDHG